MRKRRAGPADTRPAKKRRRASTSSRGVLNVMRTVPDVSDEDGGNGKQDAE
jgi:hypothetical protein